MSARSVMSDRTTVLDDVTRGMFLATKAMDTTRPVLDASGYPDCRPAFVAAFEQLANLATAAAVEGRARYSIHAPLLHLSKAQIILAAEPVTGYFEDTLLGRSLSVTCVVRFEVPR